VSITLTVLVFIAVAAFAFARIVKRNSAPWYSVPFTEGVAYIARSTIIGDFDRIEKDSVLVYRSTGFSRYDGYIGFFFTDSDGKKRRWDINDSLDPVSEAKKLFEKASR
jgi:hypothetical protein